MAFLCNELTYTIEILLKCLTNLIYKSRRTYNVNYNKYILSNIHSYINYCNYVWTLPSFVMYVNVILKLTPFFVA